MSPWEILGLEPAATTAEIRRAYAVLLKRTRPEDDPAGFQRLRAAYETALALNQRQPVVAVAAPQIAEPPPIPAEPPVSPQPIPLDEIARDTIQIIIDAFGRGDGQAAAILLAAAIDKNLLPIAAEIGLAERLVQVLLADRTIPPERLLDIAAQFNWYGQADALRGRNGQAERQLCARIDAELWLGGLRAQAKDWLFWIGDQGVGAARLLLGRGPMLLSWLLPPEPPLSAMAGQLVRHYGWIAPHFSERRLRDVQQLTKRMRKRKLWQPRILAGLLVACVGVAMLIKIDVTAMIVILPLVFFARAPHAVRSVFIASMALFGLLWINAMTGWISPTLSSPRWVDYTMPGGTLKPLPVESIENLRKRADQGYVDATYKLANAYLVGHGVSQDFVEAAKWLKISAEQGNLESQHNLGVLYQNGLGVPKDYAESRRLFSKCFARLGNCAADLGFLYYSGLGVVQDYSEAKKYNEISASRGEPVGQFNLGTMFAFGNGVILDPVQAFKWTKAAAIQRLPAAMGNLGQFYNIGFGIKQNGPKARAWLTAAAEAGEPQAMFNLGVLLQQGEPSKAEDVSAYRWLSLAVRFLGIDHQDFPEAKEEQELVSARLTPDQRAKADAEIASWKPQIPSSLPETDGDIPN